eukprot:5728082-Pyramimonas_sp.AAC.1
MVSAWCLLGPRSLGGWGVHLQGTVINPSPKGKSLWELTDCSSSDSGEPLVCSRRRRKKEE